MMKGHSIPELACHSSSPATDVRVFRGRIRALVLSSPPRHARNMAIKTGLESDLSGKVAVVTGCNTGIGLQTAKILCDAGAHVVMACRSKERAKAALAEVTAGGGSAEIMVLDLGDTPTIKAFASSFTKKHDTLDILVNNAGLNTTGSYKGPTTTKQGYEICMGTNYFGHFLLTSLLMPALLKSDDARVVSLSSVTTWFASNKYQVRRILDFPNPDTVHRPSFSALLVMYVVLYTTSNIYQYCYKPHIHHKCTVYLPWSTAVLVTFTIRTVVN